MLPKRKLLTAMHMGLADITTEVCEMAGQRKESWQSLGGLDISRIYGPDEAGQPPYTRGIHSTMYRSKLWTMRQYAGFGSAEETNERFKLLLERGQKGLSVAFDLPTQLGLDADDELSIGEVGKVGVSISCLDDMRILLRDLPLDKVSTSMTINAPAMVLLAMYVLIAEENGVSSHQIRGTIQNDILKEYIARGTYIFPPKESMRLITDIFEYCKLNIPNWNTISISGYHIREAGSTAVQEIAFTIANALEYVQAAIDSGQDIDDFAPRLSFFFNCHNDFFEEVGKFRAARKLWYDLLTNRYSPKNDKSVKLRFHTQVAGVSLTAQQPINNVSRVTIQALAAVCGGTQSLHTNSYDEALGLPTEESATVALRTQQIIAEESGVADVVDPLGGSYLVEEITQRIYDDALEQIKKIEKLGGALTAIESGYQQKEIHEAAWKHLGQVETGKRRIVGVNYATLEDEKMPPVLKPDPQIGINQARKLNDLRGNRNLESVQSALNSVRDACISGENLFPRVIDCLRNDCTLGEIIGVMKEEFGTYMAPSGF